jgi:5-methylcytosine-specific restriction enzyme A
MLRDAFIRISQDYTLARETEFGRNELGNLIRKELPMYVTHHIDNKNIKWVASTGKGNWAFLPWIAGLHRLITNSPQKGYYPVFLFSSSFDRIYLSMNQGVSELRNVYRDKRARKILRERAIILRLTSKYSQKNFPVNEIALEANHNSTLASFYEAGHAFGKLYETKSLPNEDSLIADLKEMVTIYEDTVFNNTVVDAGIETNDHFDDVTREEKLQYAYHRKIERNAKLPKIVKKLHGYTCEVCGFDFKEAYGELGYQYIEAHHKIPLSHLKPEKSISLSAKADFAVVCANCHRMLHRKDAPKTFEEFQQKYAYLRKR